MEVEKAMDSVTPVENNEYNVLTTLHSKLEGSQAYHKYIEDANQAGDSALAKFFEQLKSQDDAQILQLRQHLARLLGQG